MKTFFQLLGIAQTAMLELAEKFKNSPPILVEEYKINNPEKPAQPRSVKKLSNNEQTSKNKHEVKSFKPEDQSCSTDVCTQVACEKDDYFNKKETISNVTTSVADTGHTINKAYVSADENVKGNIIGQEVDAIRSTENLDDVYSLNKTIGYLGYFVERAHTNYDFSSISGKTEKSSTSEEVSLHSIYNKNQPEPKESEAFDNTLDTCKKCTKGVKPLKDRATEIIISTIISQLNHKDSEQMKSGKGKKLDVCENSQGMQQLHPTKEIQTDVSLKTKLSIQMMPSIDIRRGLVTQTIPTIVITPSESTPQQKIVQDSNVGYEVVRHVSHEVVNKAVEPINVKPQTHSGVQINKIRSKTSSEIEKKTYTDDDEGEQSPLIDQTHELESYHTGRFKRDFPEASADTLETSSNTSGKVQKLTEDGIEEKASSLTMKARQMESYHSKASKGDFPEVSSDTLGSAKSSVPTCAHVMFNRTIPQALSVDARSKSFVEATVKLDMPVTTFVNTCFKTESDSEILLDNDDMDVQIPNTDSSTTKKSTIANFFGKRECAKEFVNEMMKDPKTEVIFKSYQVMQDQSTHVPDHEWDDSNLSFIDTEVYKTFVNPDGFKERRPSETSATRDIRPFSNLSVVTPPEFYSTKATQCDEIIENVPDETPPNDKPKQNAADDNASQNTQVLRSDSVSQASTLFRDFDTQTMLSYKPEARPQFDGRAIVQDPGYISRNPNIFPQSVSPRVSTGHSHLNIPPDIQKRLAGSSSVQRNSATRSSFNRRPSPSRGLELVSPQSLKRLSEHSAQLKSSRSSRSLDVIEAQNGSINSETTEDVIFEINREKLRSATHYSRVDLDQVGDLTLQRQVDSGSRKNSAISRATEVQSVASTVTSEYVITHDVSQQTSLTGFSEASLDLHQFSKESFGSSIEELKVIVGEDTQSEDNVHTFSCCTKLVGTKKKTPKDVYIKSMKQAQPVETIVDDSLFPSEIERLSIKLDVPEAVPVYKPRPVTLSLPENPPQKRSHTGVTPVGSFIEGLTSHNKNEIIIARNAPLRNELSVLEEYGTSEIVNAIKHNTESWKELDKLRLSATAENSSQTSAHDLSLRIPKITANLVQEENKTKTENNILNKTKRKNSDSSETDSENSSTSNDEAYTIMSVNVEHPKVTQDQLFSMKHQETVKSTNDSSSHRNAPGGDEANSEESFRLGSNAQFYPTHAKHEGIFPRHHRHRLKQLKKINESSSSSEPTTPWGSLSEKTDGNLSEGEIKCKCSASIGEIHVCPYGKKQKPIQYLKRNPQKLLKHEFGNSNVKVKWSKEFNSNWVAYYVSRSPSPELDNTESVDKSSTDSSGIIRK